MARLPIIVGGAAAEYHTASAIQSGDVDLVEGETSLLEEALLEVGFRKEDRKGHLLRGLYLIGPDYEIGVEFVSGSLFEGRADRGRIENIGFEHDSVLRFPSVKDMIADRLGQYASNPTGHPDRLEQARLLWILAGEIDLPYLKKRAVEESGLVNWLDKLGDRDA